MRKKPDSRWWDEDDLVTLVDAVALTGLDEPAIDALVEAGKVAEIVVSGIRFYRRADLLAIGAQRAQKR